MPRCWIGRVIRRCGQSYGCSKKRDTSGTNEEALRYVYLPTLPRERAKRSALSHMLETFFDGSAEQAVAALLDLSAAKLSKTELDRLARLIEEAKAKGDWK
jgi:predicted transcriptional regulator